MKKKILLNLFFTFLAAIQIFTSIVTHMNLVRIGKAGKDVTENIQPLMYLLNGVLAILSSVFESGHWYGIFSGIYILIIPLVILGLIKSKYYFSSLILAISIIMSTSMILTGYCYNILIGLGGLIALPVGLLFFGGIFASNIARDKEDKHLKEFEKALENKK